MLFEWSAQEFDPVACLIRQVGARIRAIPAAYVPGRTAAGLVRFHQMLLRPSFLVGSRLASIILNAMCFGPGSVVLAASFIRSCTGGLRDYMLSSALLKPSFCSVFR